MIRRCLLAGALLASGILYGGSIYHPILPGGCVVDGQLHGKAAFDPVRLTAAQAESYIRHVIDAFFFPPLHKDYVEQEIGAFTDRVIKHVISKHQLSSLGERVDADHVYQAVLKCSKLFVRRQAYFIAMRELNLSLIDMDQKKKRAKEIAERIFVRIDTYSKSYKESELPFCAFEHYIGKGLEVKVKAELEQEAQAAHG